MIHVTTELYCDKCGMKFSTVLKNDPDSTIRLRRKAAMSGWKHTDLLHGADLCPYCKNQENDHD